MKKEKARQSNLAESYASEVNLFVDAKDEFQDDISFQTPKRAKCGIQSRQRMRCERKVRRRMGKGKVLLQKFILCKK